MPDSPDTCGRGNFLIRKENVADSKITYRRLKLNSHQHKPSPVINSFLNKYVISTLPRQPT